jgi:hypothetical protein
LLLIVGVLIMVVDHRRGWLTGILIDGMRSFHSPRVVSSSRSKRRSDDDDDA